MKRSETILFTKTKISIHLCFENLRHYQQNTSLYNIILKVQLHKLLEFKISIFEEFFNGKLFHF